MTESHKLFVGSCVCLQPWKKFSYLFLWLWWLCCGVFKAMFSYFLPKPGWKVTLSNKAGGLPVIKLPVQAAIPRVSACNLQQDEDICSPGSPVLCSVVRKISLLWWEWSCWKNLGSSVAQILIMMICKAVCLLRVLGVQKSGEIKKVQDDRKNIVKLLCMLD